MTSIPSNLGRVPNSLASRISLSNLGRTNASLLRVQSQIATGREVLRPSDDIVRSATISVLDDRLERSEQLLRNFSHADSALGVLDSVLAEANEFALQGKSIASGQVGSLTTASDRAGAALVVDQLIHGLFNGVNRASVAGYVLGGSQTSRAPIEAFLGGFKYTGSGPGLTTDLGFASAVPITLGSGNPLTATSTRVRGSVDLDPVATMDTRLGDLNGARGLGVSMGTFQFSFSGAPAVTVDLSSADTIGDVAAQLTGAIRQYETDNAVTVLGPGGISVSGSSFSIDVAPGVPAPSLAFFEVGTGVTARDLGLTADTPFVFSPTTATGASLDPKATWLTPITALAGVTGTLGSIKVSNAGRSATIDLSSAQTLQDVRNLIEGSGLGVRVAINAEGTGIDVLNELSAGSAGALSISEVTGQGLTATRLGIRTLTSDTSLQDFNFGSGVHVVDGKINPDGRP